MRTVALARAAPTSRTGKTGVSTCRWQNVLNTQPARPPLQNTGLVNYRAEKGEPRLGEIGSRYSHKKLKSAKRTACCCQSAVRESVFLTQCL